MGLGFFAIWRQLSGLRGDKSYLVICRGEVRTFGLMGQKKKKKPQQTLSFNRSVKTGRVRSLRSPTQHRNRLTHVNRCITRSPASPRRRRAIGPEQRRVSRGLTGSPPAGESPLRHGVGKKFVGRQDNRDNSIKNNQTHHLDVGVSPSLQGGGESPSQQLPSADRRSEYGARRRPGSPLTVPLNSSSFKYQCAASPLPYAIN